MHPLINLHFHKRFSLYSQRTWCQSLWIKHQMSTSQSCTKNNMIKSLFALSPLLYILNRCTDKVWVVFHQKLLVLYFPSKFPKRNAGEPASQAGVWWEYLQEECRNSIFFFFCPPFYFGGILRCSKGIAEGGPGYSQESKRLCGLWSPASHSMQNYSAGVLGFSTCERDGSLLYCTQRQTEKWKRSFVGSLITVRHCDC